MRIRESRVRWGRNGLLAILAGLMSVPAWAAQVTSPVTFSGNAQTFMAQLGVSGTLTGDGAGTVFPAPSTLTINVPSQTVNINLLSGGNANTHPGGTATIGYNNVDLSNGSVSDLNVNLLNGTILNYSFQQIILTGTAVQGGSTAPLQVISNITGTVADLTFIQDPGAQIVGGMLAGRATGNLTANLGLKLKVGLASINVPLDPILFDIDEPISIPANLGLTDLETGLALPHDARARISGSLPSLVVPINIAEPFHIMDTSLSADIMGNFSLNINLALNNLAYNLEAVITDAVVPPGCDLIGDANNDNSVGAADYAIWAAQFGQSGANLSADFDNNGSVGAGDYTLWAANFGNTCPPGASGASSVPEPSTGALALLALATVAGIWRRRR